MTTPFGSSTLMSIGEKICKNLRVLILEYRFCQLHEQTSSGPEWQFVDFAYLNINKINITRLKIFLNRLS